MQSIRDSRDRISSNPQSDPPPATKITLFEHRAIYVLIAVLFSVVTGGGGAWLNSINSRLGSLESAIASERERRATNEANMMFVKDQLSRVEGKIDVLTRQQATK